MTMNRFLQDFRYALRQLSKNPGFSTVIVMTIALGTGATTAMFSLVDRTLFRSLPYAHADELVSVGVVAPIIDGEFLFAGSYLDWQKHETAFSSFTSSTGVTDCDLSDEHAVRLSCAAVDSTFLPTFGIQPVLGRNFTSDEGRPNAPKVALLSYSLWQTRFAGDRSIIGRTISLDGRPTRVLGVLPRGFEFPTLTHVSVVVPEALDESIVQRGQLGPVVRVYGRMKPGRGIESTAAQLQPLFRKFVDSAPPPFRKALRLEVRSLRDFEMHGSRLPAWLLLISALAVLLVACANAASVVIARGIARRHELAVRVALGARRSQLFQQRLTESVLLALVGGAVGCGLAWIIVRTLVALAPAGIPRLSEASLDIRVFLFAFLLSMAAGILFGAVPALEKPAIETLVATTLAGARKARFRQFLLFGQVVMTVILLAGALLFLRTLRNFESEPLGMNTQNVVTAEITLGQRRYAQADQRLAFFEQLEGRLKQLPGISGVALSDSLPPSEPARTMPFIALHAEGQLPLSTEHGIGGVVGWRSVTPEYFSVLGIPILHGRTFTEQDRSSQPNAIVLNHILAQRFFPGQDALGKTIRFEGSADPPSSPVTFTVIGVTGNTQNEGLGGRVAPEYYVVRRHSPDDLVFHAPDSQRISMVVRSPLTAQTVASELSDAVAALDSTIPVQASTLTQIVYRLAQRPRFSAALLLLFGGMSLLLAAGGIFGLVSLLVNQRTQEIAIHIALGANPATVARNMVLEASTWVALGAAGGILCWLVIARWVSSLLFGVKPNDPVTLAEAALGLLAVALIAAYIPARRAAKVDPMWALRYE
jgi:predicted permease